MAPNAVPQEVESGRVRAGVRDHYGIPTLRVRLAHDIRLETENETLNFLLAPESAKTGVEKVAKPTN